MATGSKDRRSRKTARCGGAASVRVGGDAPGRWSRRGALRFGAAALVGGLAAPALAQNAARIVVVGGGVAGVGAAARLAQDPTLSVTLVVMEARYTTGSFSNLYLAGFRSLASLTFRYDAVAQRAGFRVIVDRAVAVERTAKEVRLASGARLGYERLVLAPGVAFRDSEIVGYDVFARQLMPHGYQGGLQTFQLKARIKAMPQGGVFAITVPRAPFRGALAPYERAGMIALALGRSNPRAKVVVLDANRDFPMRSVFLQQWRARYGDRIEWRGGAAAGGELARVDAPNMTLIASDGSRLKVDAANVIPAQRAGAIALQAELADDEGWASVAGASMRSSADPAIFVIGDAARDGAAEKTADVAQAQAAAASAAIRADLAGAQVTLSGQTATQWAFVGHQAAVKSAVAYGAAQGGGATETALAATAEELRTNALDANSWYAQLTDAAFG